MSDEETRRRFFEGLDAVEAEKTAARKEWAAGSSERKTTRMVNEFWEYLNYLNKTHTGATSDERGNQKKLVVFPKAATTTTTEQDKKPDRNNIIPFPTR